MPVRTSFETFFVGILLASSSLIPPMDHPAPDDTLQRLNVGCAESGGSRVETPAEQAAGSFQSSNIYPEGATGAKGGGFGARAKPTDKQRGTSDA